MSATDTTATGPIPDDVMKLAREATASTYPYAVTPAILSGGWDFLRSIKVAARAIMADRAARPSGDHEADRNFWTVVERAETAEAALAETQEELAVLHEKDRAHTAARLEMRERLEKVEAALSDAAEDFELLAGHVGHPTHFVTMKEAAANCRAAFTGDERKAGK